LCFLNLLKTGFLIPFSEERAEGRWGYWKVADKAGKDGNEANVEEMGCI